jgi:hypothetical protein
MAAFLYYVRVSVVGFETGLGLESILEGMARTWTRYQRTRTGQHWT